MVNFCGYALKFELACPEKNIIEEDLARKPDLIIADLGF